MAEGEEAEINENDMTEEDEGELGEDEVRVQVGEMEEFEEEMEHAEGEMGQPEEEEGEGEESETYTDEIKKAPNESEVQKPRHGGEILQSETLQGKIDDETMKELLQVEKEAKEAANAIYELKIRIEKLLKKEKMTEAEEKELEEKNLELKDLMMLFDERTLKIQELIANTKILESMPVRQPQAKHEEDVLPRVILCGLEDDYVPKFIVCNQKVKSTSGRSHECFPGCPGPSPPPCIPSATKEPKFSSPEKNEELENIKSKLEQDITTKNRLLEELQIKLQILQNEIHTVATENAQLNDKIRRMQQDQARKIQQSHQPKKMCPNMLAVKLQEYGKYTRKLERQVTEMEEDLDRVHREICEAMKARDRMTKNPKISPCKKR